MATRPELRWWVQWPNIRCGARKSPHLLRKPWGARRGKVSEEVRIAFAGPFPEIRCPEATQQLPQGPVGEAWCERHLVSSISAKFPLGAPEGGPTAGPPGASWACPALDPGRVGAASRCVRAKVGRARVAVEPETPLTCCTSPGGPGSGRCLRSRGSLLRVYFPRSGAPMRLYHSRWVLWERVCASAT